jgi:quinol monooxygenase YgiN
VLATVLSPVECRPIPQEDDVLIVVGSAWALPGRRDELVAAAGEVTTATRGDEGCRSYGFYADLTDQDTILGLEIWRDQAALDAHMAHAHTQDFLARVSGLLDGTPEMAFHQVPDPA